MITSTDIKKQYAPLTPTDTFPFDISYFEATDLSVIISAAGLPDQYLTQDAVSDGFTVTPVNGDPEFGATIDTTETYTTGETITIVRDVPMTQEVELIRGGDIPPEVINDSLDRGVAIDQQLASAATRSIVAPISDPAGLSYLVSTVALRAGKALGFDEVGNVIGIDLVSTGSIGVDSDRGLEMNNNVIRVKVGDRVSFDGSGALTVANAETDDIVDGAITTPKLVDGIITFAKMDSDVLNTPYQEYTSVKSVTGTVELAVADGSLIKMTMTGDTTLSFNLADYVDDGVNRISIDLYTGGFALTLDTASIDSSTSFILDGSAVNSLLFRSSGSGKFFGRQ